ncbi:MAG: cupin domain-containing protein [Bacteroidota bacterium]
MQTIHFARPDGKDLQIEIIKYQPEDLSRNRTPDRHRHAFHSIFFILDGTSLQEVDFDEYELAAGQVMFIPTGSVHWEKETQNLSGYTILFKDEFFSIPQKQLLDAVMQYAVALRKLLITIEDKETEVLKTYFELLYAEQEQDWNQNHTFILQNLMLALINKL